MNIDENKIALFCQKNHIESLALFGSVLTDKFKPSSDIDILVKFEVEYTPTLFDMVDMESELESIVGLPVDLKTARELSPYFREDVLRKAKFIFRKHVI